MRRLLLSLGLACLALPLLAGTATASHNFNNVPPNQDFVKGSGNFVVQTPFGTCNEFLALDIKSNKFSQKPYGYFYKVIDCGTGPMTLAGNVITCFAPNGNPFPKTVPHTDHAVFRGVVTNSSSPGFVGGGVIIEVDDNNSPASLYPGPDRVGEIFTSPSSTCPKPNPTAIPTNIVTSGGFVVHDALPYDP